MPAVPADDAMTIDERREYLRIMQRRCRPAGRSAPRLIAEGFRLTGP